MIKSFSIAFIFQLVGGRFLSLVYILQQFFSCSAAHLLASRRIHCRTKLYNFLLTKHKCNCIAAVSSLALLFSLNYRGVSEEKQKVENEERSAKKSDQLNKEVFIFLLLASSRLTIALSHGNFRKNFSIKVISARRECSSDGVRREVSPRRKFPSLFETVEIAAVDFMGWRFV